MWHENILGTIGNTPLVRLNGLARGLKPIILMKLEYMNPGGSVKDRIGIKMLEEAEEKGQIQPGGTVIEGTSGNTGVGLALAAAVKGYQCIFTMPDKMSQEKIDTLRALGAEVIVTPTQVGHYDPRSYHSVAMRLSSEIPNSLFPNQYENFANTLAHCETTGPEIWEQTDGKVTHLVSGIGTGGTISGTARYLKEQNSDIRVIGVDPIGSVFAGMFQTGKRPEPQPYTVEGIGQDEKPLNSLVDFSVIDEIHEVSDRDSFLVARQLARQEGVFAGGSAGSAVYVAVKCAEQMKESDLIVVIIPDSGMRYLSKMYNDNWMRDNQYLQANLNVHASQVVREKIRRAKSVLSLELADTIEAAVKMMREHEISQLPVIERGSVVGSISETRILEVLVSDPSIRSKPVAEHMEPPFVVLAEDASINMVAEHMKGEMTAVLIEKGKSFDIITKSDLILFLTKLRSKG